MREHEAVGVMQDSGECEHPVGLGGAIRDAHGAGLIEVADPTSKARMIQVYYEGLLTQARIQNDVEVLRETLPGAFAILVVKSPETATV